MQKKTSSPVFKISLLPESPRPNRRNAVVESITEHYPTDYQNYPASTNEYPHTQRRAAYLAASINTRLVVTGCAVA